MITISYAITVKDELKEIQQLVPFLLKNKRPKDEIVILYDQRNGDERVVDYLLEYNKLPNVQTWRGFFDNHFAEWKNKLTEYCKNDYIFQIDADEIPHISLLQNLPIILEDNNIDLILVPRVNTVEGITQEHINKWGWRINENNWINYPDYQFRVYKNISTIKWVNKVHERLEGYENISYLPAEEEWSLYHPKTIERQEKQNNYYNTL
jgi:hypothetical protein